MIDRYSKKEITSIFSLEAKFNYWLKTEKSVIKARADMGLISAEIPRLIEEQARFDITRIDEIELIVKHDMLAFVQSVQESLEEWLRKFFHELVTSYDIEEPSTALQILDAMQVIMKALDRLLIALKKRAIRHKKLLKVFRTHGQHAQPGPLGQEILWWYDAFKRQKKYLNLATNELKYSKISGGVGTYGSGLSPELERRALSYLGLKPVKVSAQIILRDRHAHLMNALGVLISLVEHVSENLRFYGITEVCEIQEPFGKGQKGSSYFPQKKNTILNENLCGQARTARLYALGMMECIPTWNQRDISHSSTERVVVPDMFELVNYSLCRLTGVIENMVVNEDRIRENLEFSRGTIFAPDVKDMLMHEGIEPETAYLICQQSAFTSHGERIDFIDALLAHPWWPVAVSRQHLEEIFDYEKTVRYTDEIFRRTLR